MPDPAVLAVFVLAAVLLAVVPGPAVLYIVAQSIAHGRAAGVASALGVSVGGLVHVAAAALGLSSLLVRSAVAFEIVKYAGAAYLVLLGIRTLLSAREPVAVAEAKETSLRRIFRQGVVVNVLNPKTALFFFSFLPQFVDPDRGAVGAQVLLLGLLFVTVALASDTAYGLVAGALGARLRRSYRLLRAQRFVSGGALVGLGVAAAAAGRK
jgi:threonine/homoserine/homoserine lactone efflux protein